VATTSFCVDIEYFANVHALSFWIKSIHVFTHDVGYALLDKKQAYHMVKPALKLSVPRPYLGEGFGWEITSSSLKNSILGF
jgi:hypothetical protein